MDLSGGAGTVSGASHEQAVAAWQSAALMREMMGYARQDVAPWRTAGMTAMQQIGGLLGLPGYTAVDPTKALLGTPGYQWLQSQGIKARDQSAAARGMLLSGAQQKALTDWGQQLGLTYAWQPYMSALRDMAGQGLGAATQSGQWAMGTGQAMGQNLMAASNALAQGQLGAYNAGQAGLSGLMSGIGMLGSLALAPFTGGTSLLGLAGQGIGSLLGAGAGGITSGLGGYSALGSTPMWDPSMFSTGLGLLQEGGPALIGRPYIVGERGPELFVPTQDGVVVPNHALYADNYVSALRLAA